MRMGRASVSYDGVPNVEAEGGGGTASGVRADANDFGAQVGTALERAGNAGQEYVHREMGMINETAANNAETEYLKQSSMLTGKLKSMQGLDAKAFVPTYQQELSALRTNLRSKLPPNAARMFDATTHRHEAYAIGDAETYGAAQLKKATLDSNNAVAQNAITGAGSISVAANDKRFGENLGDIHHSVASMMELQGYGAYTRVDPETGAVSFDEATPEGQQAKSVYDNELNQRVGQAWENRLRTLSNTNIKEAYDKYRENINEIPGDTQVRMDAYFTPKIRDYQARTTADGITAQADQEYRQKVYSPAAVKATDLASAIHIQESGGKYGDWQVQPGTFQQYAKEGESMLNKDDQEKVGRRIVADLSQRFNGDAARVAVGYFSGPGNVSPEGSEKPWIKDHQDKNGKTVSSYVEDITRRMGGEAKSGPLAPPPSKADYYRSNYTKIVNDAVTQAQQEHPDDPDYTDKVRAKVEQRMNDTIRQEDMNYKANNQLVFRAFNGEFSDGKRPTSLEQLTNASPEVKTAWENMETTHPQTAALIENRILTANGQPHDEKQYGAGFYDLFKGVHAPDGDPNKITDVTQLYKHVGAGGDLTIAGLDKLQKELSGNNTPEGDAEKMMKKQFFAAAKAQISGADNALGIKDPKGEQLFLKFMANALPAIENAKNQGKTPAEIFNPDSPDYVGKSISTFKRPMTVYMNDMMTDTANPGGQRTLQDIVNEARLTTDPEKKMALKAEAVKLGFVRDDSVAVPRPVD